MDFKSPIGSVSCQSLLAPHNAPQSAVNSNSQPHVGSVMGRMTSRCLCPLLSDFISLKWRHSSWPGDRGFPAQKYLKEDFDAAAVSRHSVKICRHLTFSSEEHDDKSLLVDDTFVICDDRFVTQVPVFCAYNMDDDRIMKWQ